MSLQVREELHEALKKVRDDKSEEDFVLAAYEDDSTLTVAACGSGGADAMKEHFLDNDICYGLIRTTFTWEKVGQVQADTTKFVFVTWRPDSIPLKRKMKIGSLDGQVKKLFSSYHTDMDINSKDEISAEIVSDLIKEITMTADHRTEKKGTKMFFLGGNRLSWRKAKDDAASAKMNPDSRAEFKPPPKGADVKFEDEDVIKEAIADVRNDSTSTRWCLAGYLSKDTIGLIAKGDGDVSELLAHCTDTQAAYGLFRVSEVIDKTTATRFCYVCWTPDNIPPMTKARISTHKGTVNPLFRPYHQDFYISEKEELSEEIALEKIQGLTGTKSHVTERKEVKVEKQYVRKFLGGVKGEAQKLEFVDKEDLLVGIADVRNDSSSTNWVVAGFEGEKKDVQLKFHGTGSGGINEMVDLFGPDKIMFGLLRNEEVYDRSTTVKFYYFQWQGEDVSMTTKGHTGVFQGAVNAVFSPYHDDIYGSTVDEIIANAKLKIKNLDA